MAKNTPTPNPEKQIFLDKTPETNTDWVIQQMLILLTKTEIEQLRRMVDKLNSAIYKSWAKQMPLNEIHECLQEAEKLNKPQDGNKMEI